MLSVFFIKQLRSNPVILGCLLFERYQKFVVGPVSCNDTDDDKCKILIGQSYWGNTFITKYLVKKVHLEIYLLYFNVVDAQISEGTKVSNISGNFTKAWPYVNHDLDLAPGLWLWLLAYDSLWLMVVALVSWFFPLHMIVTHGLTLLHTTLDCISWPMKMASANITVNFTKNLTWRKSRLWPLAYDCGPWLNIVAHG